MGLHIHTFPARPLTLSARLGLKRGDLLLYRLALTDRTFKIPFFVFGNGHGEGKGLLAFLTCKIVRGHRQPPCVKALSHVPSCSVPSEGTLLFPWRFSDDAHHNNAVEHTRTHPRSSSECCGRIEGRWVGLGRNHIGFRKYLWIFRTARRFCGVLPSVSPVKANVCAGLPDQFLRIPGQVGILRAVVTLTASRRCLIPS